MNTNVSLNEISQRWLKEGKEYKDAINAWLDIIYLQNKQPETPEPKETRADMADLVMAQVEEFNARGDFRMLRELLPPDNEPLFQFFDKSANKFNAVTKVLMLPDNRIVVKAKDTCFLLQDYQIEELAGLLFFGASVDKTLIAKAYLDHIIVSEGWDGPVIKKFSYPESYGPEFGQQYPNLIIDKSVFNGEGLEIRNLQVFPDGDRLLLTSPRGVFVIGANMTQLVHPQMDSFKEVEDPWICWPKNTSNEENEPYALYMHYPHADLSPDGFYIATGSQDSCHIVLKEENGRWAETAWIEPRSSYPNAAKFNYRIINEDEALPSLALSSCHFSQSATIGIPVANLPGLEASGYDMDHERLWVIDDRFWTYSILDGKNTFVLGTNTGYIWLKMGHDDSLYIYVGGTVLSMDISTDRKSFIIGNSLGQVIKLRHAPAANPVAGHNNRQDPYLVTNTVWVDELRYLFPTNKRPLIW